CGATTGGRGICGVGICHRGDVRGVCHGFCPSLLIATWPSGCHPDGAYLTGLSPLLTYEPAFPYTCTFLGGTVRGGERYGASRDPTLFPVALGRQPTRFPQADSYQRAEVSGSYSPGTPRRHTDRTGAQGRCGASAERGGDAPRRYWA